MSSRPPPRTIKRLLVANRGEIATRILATTRELGIQAIATYTKDDTSHIIHASEAVELPSPASYLDISHLTQVAKQLHADAVHPGYGFLSESAEFSKRMWDEAGVMVIGPGWEVLERTGDKLMARKLAEQCSVPVCPALQTPTSSVSEITQFVRTVGYPIMIKAVDGGGGRGIRLVRRGEDLEGLLKRAIQESPSKMVFCEKAAIDGFRHIEVQIVGDGSGKVAHLWERECSIQRKYQKIVELAPSRTSNRGLVGEVIQAAVRMAKKINYFSLGTFEFLVNPGTNEYYFLEINPRLQVEHTITESICSLDIVATQLRIAQGATLTDLNLLQANPSDTNSGIIPPASNLHSIQFRLTAENIDLPSSPSSTDTEDNNPNWTLSIGKIQTARLPSGNGIRIDTHIVQTYPTLVSSEFDSLIAKIIITASSWEDVVQKSQRALAETYIAGVKTNLDVLRAIAASEDFREGRCDTRWLEGCQRRLIEEGKSIAMGLKKGREAIDRIATAGGGAGGSGDGSGAMNVVNSQLLFRKGDAWNITLVPESDKGKNGVSGGGDAPTHHLELSRVLRNEFPTSMSADVVLSDASNGSSTPYTMHLASTTSSSAAALSKHRRGSPGNPSHVLAPFSGRLMEILVDEGDHVKQGDVICVIRQMKMELEVRSADSGTVTWVCEVEDDEDVGEGVLICELDLDETGRDGNAAKPRL